jgi:uncharacterized OB-fold protein
MKRKSIVRSRTSFLNGKRVFTEVETVCGKCGNIMKGYLTTCSECGNLMKFGKSNK